MRTQFKAAIRSFSGSVGTPVSDTHISINGSSAIFYFRSCDFQDIRSGTLVVNGADGDCDFCSVSWSFPFITRLVDDNAIFESFHQVDLEKLLGEEAYLDFDVTLSDFMNDDGEYFLYLDAEEFSGNMSYSDEDDVE